MACFSPPTPTPTHPHTLPHIRSYTPTLAYTLQRQDEAEQLRTGAPAPRAYPVVRFLSGAEMTCFPEQFTAEVRLCFFLWHSADNTGLL